MDAFLRGIDEALDEGYSPDELREALEEVLRYEEQKPERSEPERPKKKPARDKTAQRAVDSTARHPEEGE